MLEINTSYHGQKILATRAMLEKCFGSPHYQGEKNEKVQYEWCLYLGDEPFTIYDWKEYRLYNVNEAIEWHIGSTTKEVGLQAMEMIVEGIDALSKTKEIGNDIDAFILRLKLMVVDFPNDADLGKEVRKLFN